MDITVNAANVSDSTDGNEEVKMVKINGVTLGIIILSDIDIAMIGVSVLNKVMMGQLHCHAWCLVQLLQ